MALDPNWFYSTLAQSTAAIVGLAGGFLAQRVVAQRGDLGGERVDLRGQLDGIQSNIDQQRPHIVQVLNSMNEQLDVVAAAKEAGQKDVVLQLGLFTTFSHGRGYAINGPEQPLVEIAEKYLTEARDAAAALLDVFPASTYELIGALDIHAGLDHKSHGWLRDPPGEFPVDGIDPTNVWRWMPFQRGQAQQIFREQDFAVESVVLGILALLLVAGVIAPMFFLSAKDDASRPLLMGFFIPLSLAFLGYLAFELRRLRQAGDLTRDF
jgi:hypothetical protein